jgi:hypothetical protein
LPGPDALAGEWPLATRKACDIVTVCVIVLTSRRLVHRDGSSSCEVLLRAIRHVDVRHHASGVVTISVRTSDCAMTMALPTALAMRLAELLSARTR